MFPQTCFSMRGSDSSMVDNSVNDVKVVTRLHAQFSYAFWQTNVAQFIACFLKTAVVARTVFSILFENQRSETHSFYNTFWKHNLARTVFTMLLEHCALARTVFTTLTDCRPEATGHKLQAPRQKFQVTSYTRSTQNGSWIVPSHKRQAPSYKLTRQREGQATSVECAPNYCLWGKVFLCDLSTDRG